MFASGEWKSAGVRQETLFFIANMVKNFDF